MEGNGAAESPRVYHRLRHGPASRETARAKLLTLVTLARATPLQAARTTRSGSFHSASSSASRALALPKLACLTWP